MRDLLRSNHNDDVLSAIAGRVAAMALRECAFLDELWLKRRPTTYPALSKFQHMRFMTALTGFYFCVCEDFLEWHCPGDIDRFMDLLVPEIASSATQDKFIAKGPYSIFDPAWFRHRKYENRIEQLRPRLRFIPPYLRIEWMAARTALDLRRILRDPNDDPNELSEIECRLAQRLEWTAAELTGR